MDDLRERWRTARVEAAAYDFVVEHERLARVLGELVWGVDTSTFYREIRRIGEVADGTTIMDVPCGGGVAFRGLRADQDVRYVAADLSPVMLERARREAARRGLTQIEFLEADVESLPFDDGSIDLCLTYTGLHCFPDPAAAVTELARVLRPRGSLRGTAVVRSAGLRQECVIRLMQLGGVFGPSGTVEQLEAWLATAGLIEVSARRDGALAFFSAVRPAAG